MVGTDPRRRNHATHKVRLLTCGLVFEVFTECCFELLTVHILEGKGCEVVPHEGLKCLRPTNKLLWGTAEWIAGKVILNTHIKVVIMS